jgi:hypothetical protein
MPLSSGSKLRGSGWCLVTLARILTTTYAAHWMDCVGLRLGSTHAPIDLSSTEV